MWVTTGQTIFFFSAAFKATTSSRISFYTDVKNRFLPYSRRPHLSVAPPPWRHQQQISSIDTKFSRLLTISSLCSAREAYSVSNFLALAVFLDPHYFHCLQLLSQSPVSFRHLLVPRKICMLLTSLLSRSTTLPKWHCSPPAICIQLPSGNIPVS